jgi:hypothetical protein
VIDDDSWVENIPPTLTTLRQRAHDAFDPIWRDGWADRSTAYRLLAEELGCTEPEAHMATMTQDRLRRVPAASQRLLDRLRVSSAR